MLKTNYSVKEIQEREKAFYKDLKEFKEGVAKAHGWKRERILKLADDLEKAGTVEMENICTRIMVELTDEIESGEISRGSIWETLPDQYKKEGAARRGRKGSTRRWQKWLSKRGDLGGALSDIVEHWSKVNMDEIYRMPAEQVINESRNYRHRILLSWTDQQVYMTEQVLSIAVPLLRDTLDLIREEARGRRTKETLLSK